MVIMGMSLFLQSQICGISYVVNVLKVNLARLLFEKFLIIKLQFWGIFLA